MTQKKNHRVEMVTCQGDRVPPRDVTEAEARRLELEPFRSDSNIATVTVQPPGEQR